MMTVMTTREAVATEAMARAIDGKDDNGGGNKCNNNNNNIEQQQQQQSLRTFDDGRTQGHDHTPFGGGG